MNVKLINRSNDSITDSYRQINDFGQTLHKRSFSLIAKKVKEKR